MYFIGVFWLVCIFEGLVSCQRSVCEWAGLGLYWCILVYIRYYGLITGSVSHLLRCRFFV